MSTFFDDNIEADEFDMYRVDTYEDEDDILISNSATDDDVYSYPDSVWANFNYKNFWEKTDRWNKDNYYPTEWDLFIREE